MFKVKSKDTRTTSDVVLVFLLLTLNMFHTCSSVSIVNFEHLDAGWVDYSAQILTESSMYLSLVYH